MNEDLKNFAKKLNVLYAEDDKNSREETEKIFKLYFKNVDTAADGSEAYEKLLKNKYDILFTDSSMPKIGGMELIRKAKNIDKDIKCVVITAHSDVDFLLDMINLQVDGFLLKPINFQKLTQVLMKLLEAIKAKQIIAH